MDGLLEWDANQYARIAEHGYDAVPHAYRFFPAWPLLVRASRFATFGNTAAAAIILANVLAFAVGMAIYRLTLEETGRAPWARRTTWIALACPAAVPLVMRYAESLGTLAAVLAARRRQWWLAAVWGLLVGATWSVGWVLTPLLVFEARRDARQTGWRERVARGAAAVGPLVASGGDVLWVQAVTGDGWVVTSVGLAGLVVYATAIFLGAKVP